MHKSMILNDLSVLLKRDSQPPTGNEPTAENRFKPVEK